MSKGTGAHVVKTSSEKPTLNIPACEQGKRGHREWSACLLFTRAALPCNICHQCKARAAHRIGAALCLGLPDHFPGPLFPRPEELASAVLPNPLLRSHLEDWRQSLSALHSRHYASMSVTECPEQYQCSCGPSQTSPPNKMTAVLEAQCMTMVLAFLKV